MIQVRVAQQSAVSVRIAGAAPVRVDVTGTAVVSAPEYSGPYDITPLFTAQVLPTAKKLIRNQRDCDERYLIMATDTKLDNLVINYLTQAQYDNAKSEGTLNSNQIYMTPASSGTHTLPAATSSTLGGVKIGSNITVNSGTISISKTNVTNALGYTPPTTDTKYTLPTASAWTLGGVKIGSNITENSGTISLTKANVTSALGYTPPTTDTKYTLPTGNASTTGGVKLSDSTSSTSSTSGGIAATPAAVKAAIAEAKLAAWPIGSIYMSVNSTSPANLFGGTWERISDTFLFAASSSYPAGSTGGEFTHKLTQSELPNYSLSVTNGSNVIRSKTGSTADAYVQTQSSGWGIPNWESKTVTVASGGSGAAHNNMPPYLSVWIWKRTK